ncbi:amidohydrolase [candidate division KSB1 bacterium]
MRKLKLSILCSAMSVLILAGTVTAQGTMETYKNEAIGWVENNKDNLNQAARALWDYAETALLEYQSADYLSNFIESHGFSVERGVADLPTAFVATYGSGKPVIGILGEYDALPGLSQEAALTEKIPVFEGQPGHGCGHNLFGVASIGAAIAIKEVMQNHDIPGTIKFFGCPAEETVVGKVYMAKKGIFDDLDVCYVWHPGRTNDVDLGTSNALNNFEVTFYGKTAHAAGDPWNGRSALDAVELMNIGVNFLREHVTPTVRIHYVIPDAGMAPNVVPDYAKVWYYVRGKDRPEVEEVYERVLKIAEGSATMTDTRHEIYLITGVYNMMVNRELARVLHKNLEFAGLPLFTEQEQEFAREMQRTLGEDEDGMSVNIEPLEEPQGYTGGGSTDVADVSWIVPTASLSTACSPLNAPGHSWAIVSSSGSSIGHKGMRVAAKTIAAAGIETLLDPSIVEKARAEFMENTKDFTYESAIPRDQKPRIPVIKK